MGRKSVGNLRFHFSERFYPIFCKKSCQYDLLVFPHLSRFIPSLIPGIFPLPGPSHGEMRTIVYWFHSHFRFPHSLIGNGIGERDNADPTVAGLQGNLLPFPSVEARHITAAIASPRSLKPHPIAKDERFTTAEEVDAAAKKTVNYRPPGS